MGSDEERLVTTILLAGEALADPECGPDPAFPNVPCATPKNPAFPSFLDDLDSLRALITQIHAWIDADPRHAELLTLLRAGFGDGELLRVLFHNLFPEQPPRRALNPDGTPILSDREVEVLQATCADLAYDDIAQRLHISKKTVSRHFDNIYKKLQVNRPMQAVARAISMGYLSLSAFQVQTQASHCALRDFELFDSSLSQLDIMPQSGPQATAVAETQRRLATFGMLLMTLSEATIHVTKSVQRFRDLPPCALCEIDARNRVVRRFGQETLRSVRDVAVAPPIAQQHGFTPGNLFVAETRGRLQNLNRSIIIEYRPDGQFVRAFCGSDELGTRLAEVVSIAFGSDGRLLAASGGQTDAILAFADGGATVCRFADVIPKQICTGPDGNIYAVQHSGIGSRIRVFDPCGQLVSTLGGTPPLSSYNGLAVNSQGHIFVIRTENDLGIIEEYDASGEMLHTHSIPGLESGYLAVDALDRLYVPCRHSRDIKVLSPDGVIVRQVSMQHKLIPVAVAVGPQDTLWACGVVP
jgi:DNA-binding CsgD family transcriptional regulator